MFKILKILIYLISRKVVTPSIKKQKDSFYYNSLLRNNLILMGDKMFILELFTCSLSYVNIVFRNYGFDGLEYFSF